VHIYVHYICVHVYTASVYILLWWESLSRCTCIYTESVHICNTASVYTYTPHLYVYYMDGSHLSRCTCIYTESVHICIRYICIYIYTASACILPWWVNSVGVYEFSFPYFISFLSQMISLGILKDTGQTRGKKGEHKFTMRAWNKIRGEPKKTPKKKPGL